MERRLLDSQTTRNATSILLQVRAEYRLSAANQSVRFALEDLQVDNQLLTSGQPVVLARARGATSHN